MRACCTGRGYTCSSTCGTRVGGKAKRRVDGLPVVFFHRDRGQVDGRAWQGKGRRSVARMEGKRTIEGEGELVPWCVICVVFAAGKSKRAEELHHLRVPLRVVKFFQECGYRESQYAFLPLVIRDSRRSVINQRFHSASEVSMVSDVKLGRLDAGMRTSLR